MFTRHFEKEMHKLKKKILSLSALVESCVRMATNIAEEVVYLVPGRGKNSPAQDSDDADGFGPAAGGSSCPSRCPDFETCLKNVPEPYLNGGIFQKWPFDLRNSVLCLV